MKATGSNRILMLVAVTIVGLGLLSAIGLYALVQNKKSLPPVAQAALGGRLVYIRGEAMYPTLKDGDLVSFDTRAYLDHPPARGDIVLFIAPGDPSRVFIKRIIAIPSDRLLITNGVVFVNGERVNEPYLAEQYWMGISSWPPGGQEAVIPANQYFVMGDNRSHSSDSRSFGYVTRGEILGKLLR